MVETNRHILLYDGHCGLCNFWIFFIRERDARENIRYVSLQSEQGQFILSSVRLNNHNISSVVYLRNDKLYIKSSASLNVLKDIGGWLKLFYIFVLIPKPIRDFAYDLIARNRHHFYGGACSSHIEVFSAQKNTMTLLSPDKLSKKM